MIFIWKRRSGFEFKQEERTLFKKKKFSHLKIKKQTFTWKL